MHSASRAAGTGSVSAPALAPNPDVICSHDRAPLQNSVLEDSQTQELTEPMDWTQSGLGKRKRKHLDDPVNEDPRPFKKLKYSVAREPVELEG